MHAYTGGPHSDEVKNDKFKTICAPNASVHNNYNTTTINTTTTRSGTSKLCQEMSLTHFIHYLI